MLLLLEGYECDHQPTLEDTGIQYRLTFHLTISKSVELAGVVVDIKLWIRTNVAAPAYFGPLCIVVWLTFLIMIRYCHSSGSRVKCRGR